MLSNTLSVKSFFYLNVVTVHIIISHGKSILHIKKMIILL